MIIKTLIPLFFSLLISCTMLSQEARFRAEANDLADVTLTLKQNGKFVLQFKDIQTARVKNMRGKWTKKEKRYQLRFSPFKTPDLPTLFSTSSSGNGVKIKDDRTVSFKASRKSLLIWSILCTRE